MKLIFVATIIPVGLFLLTMVLPPATLARSQTASQNNLPGQFSGNASWYGARFHGRKTASGDIFDMHKLTAAHRRLPMPTRVLVENPRNGNSIVVKVNDRGPHAKHRVLDLSREAARQLKTLAAGVGFVECLVLPARAARM